MDTVKIKSTSTTSAIGTDIVLRVTNITRLVFRPQLVDNAYNNKASVKGIFIFQKKGRNERWEDYKEYDLTQLKSAEGVKLELKSGELFELIKQLNNYYGIYKKYGIRYGETEFIISDDNIAKVIKELTANDKYIDKLINENNAKLIDDTIEWMLKANNISQALENLKKINVNDLNKLDSLVGVTKLQKVIRLWEDNIDNSKEDFWQNLLAEYSWVISQLFASPFLIFGDKAYVGGKGISNKDGKIVDFVYKNRLTDNILLVEIKTPLTRLMGTEYRNGINSIHTDLTGAVNQVLSYKDTLHKEHYQRLHNSDEKFNVFNPKCVIIAGCFQKERMDANKRAAFELFRQELKCIEIITYDELFTKAKYLLYFLQNEN